MRLSASRQRSRTRCCQAVVDAFGKFGGAIGAPATHRNLPPQNARPPFHGLRARVVTMILLLASRAQASSRPTL